MKLPAIFAKFKHPNSPSIQGRRAARELGMFGGQPAVIKKMRDRARARYAAGERVTDIAKDYGIAKATVYKILNEGKGKQ